MVDAADQAQLLRVRRRLDRLTWLLDDSIALPGTNRRFGLDPIIGLIPGFGDLAGAVLSLWVVIEAARLGAPPPLLLRMLGNVVLESVVGMVPVAGDLFDFFWKANSRNRDLLSDYIDHQLSPETGPNVWLWVSIALILLIAALMIYPHWLSSY